MGDRVECQKKPIDLESNGRMIASIRVECLRCDHSEESFGTTERSERRCLALMRENCPEGEENYYVLED